MGQEVVCSARYGAAESTGKALLETSELVFRGDFRLVIPFKDIETMKAEDGVLYLTLLSGGVELDLGPLATKWAAKIQNPRGRLDKLDVKAGCHVGLVGSYDPDFEGELLQRAIIERGEPPMPLDLLFYGADSRTDLDRLASLCGLIKGRGAIWVVSPKGKGAVIKDTDVIAAARAAGLVDTKVVAFSASHTALKLVVPKAKR